MVQPSLTILIVDDSETDRLTYHRYLKRNAAWSCSILEAELGQTGLDLCVQNQPDIVLLDYLLPDLDGLEFLTQLKAKMPETMPPVITITGQGDEVVAVQIIQAGAEDYLIKGQITPASLQFSVEQAYEKAQLRYKLRQSEERLKLALEAAQMGTWEWKFPGNQLFCSSQVGPIFGLAPGMTLPNYEAFFAQVHAGDRRKILRAVRQAFRKHQLCEIEFRILWPNGSIHWLKGKGRFYFASDWQSGRMLGTISDVTQSKQMEIERFQALEAERLVMRISQSVRQSLNLADILQTTVTEIRQLLHTDRVIIFQLHSPDRGEVIAEAVGSEWVSVLNSDFQDPCLATQEIGIYQSGRMCAISDIDNGDLLSCDPAGIRVAARKFLAALAVKASLSMPILQGENLWGLLIAHHCVAPRYWQTGEMNLLQQLSTQLSLALQQAELYQQAQLEIQERRQTEQILRQSEERFRLLSTFAPIGIFQTDPAGRCLYTNAQWQAIAGLTLEESLGDGWAKAIHPDDRIWVFNKWNRCAQTGQEFDVEFRFLTPRGRVHWVKVNAAPIQSPTGAILGYVGTDLDITKRKQTEVELQAALQKLNFHVENSPMAVIEWNSEMQVSRWSGAAEAIFGWQAEEVLGKPPTNWQFVHIEDLPGVEAQIEAILSGQVTQHFSSNRNYTKDGKIVHCEWYNSSMTDATGNFVSMLSLVLDVSDRIRLEGERQRLLELEQTARVTAERANRIKDDFLAILSHELRSPLNPILGLSQLLQTHTFSADKTAEALATIERNAKLQTQLIDDLLDVAKILRGKLVLQKVPVDLAFAIEAALDTVRATAAVKSIDLQATIPPIGRIWGDATRLQQIVWNLLSNAIKFTPPQGQVSIRLEPIDCQAQITVRDTGKGIKPDFLPNLFESFRQEDASTTRQYGGLGLGLAIVHSLVEAHGGTITADSPGEAQGATFTVRFPLFDSQQETRSPKPNAVPDLDLQGIRVLVVDDEPDARQLLEKVLTVYEAEVCTVTSAVEALSALELWQPDVLVSDIGMPDVDGYSLIEQIRALPPEKGGKIPAIALTAYAREEDRQRAINSGFQQQLTKPLEPQQLVQVVMRLAIESDAPQKD
ncbi:MAG: PAS domain S-box protein [Jaaginema sp. PMC 1080.18]|nr:PAS domain S-box protein [Jaaginema sp. PMC 1080.18]